MSLYAEYIKERENYECIETDYGFATFAQVSDYVYIRDVYIIPEQRKNGVGKQFVNRIEEWARDRHLESIITTVKPSANGANTSIKAILATGFEIMASEKDALIFKKKI